LRRPDISGIGESSTTKNTERAKDASSTMAKKEEGNLNLALGRNNWGLILLAANEQEVGK